MRETYLNFAGRTVVVTGGSKGIGRAIVKQFVQFGARAVIADVNEDGEEDAAQWVKAGYDVRFFRCDVSVAEQAKLAIEETERAFGGVDVLVNNAGIFPRADLLGTDEAFWNKVLGINLKGAYLMSQAAVSGMIRRGGGNIVNIGSLHAATGEEVTMAYAVSKGGIVTLTRNLARGLAKHRIRVNCVQPGWVSSDGELARLKSNGMDDETIRSHGSRMPLGRMQTGEDIARSVAFMASDLAGQITGQILTVDGGASLR
ncbi:SDR family NAD(P)-dependent oxidoreductase [Paenibacillus spongiae]|uniref:SDR family oxidoreductase n=1 Tax=Paenibacillus spongiae TaxID=2909671 RepID=A0ABY5SHN5_9BACL|nr:SDR family NAD(P)-dependent oxidoreductase [Paenibacillus spongiae]UVI33259.1 SDR family oxidoreductase [Paenibacillus spongiae]